MTGQTCGLGCELPAGHAGDHDDLDGGTWPQGARRGRRGTAGRPKLDLDQLTAQLKKFEGQVITNAAGLAITLMMGAEQDGERLT